MAGSQTSLAWLFAPSSLLVVCAQLPVTRWVTHRLDLRRSMATGLLLIAAGFTVVAAAQHAALGLAPAAVTALPVIPLPSTNRPGETPTRHAQ